MSQEKAQLIAPIGIMTVSGVTATGVITATSLSGNIAGAAKSLVNGTNVTTGVITATSFVGNLTGNILRLADSAPDINVGASTATSFVGNLTGSVTDLTSAPNITVGVVTATTFEGPVTGNVTGNATGLAGGLGVNYNGGWTGAGTSQINAGVVTATTFYGDGSNLSGVSAGLVSQQSIGITSAATAIDLSNGNLIYATQSANTTVSFASTSNGNVYFIRKDDDSGTLRTITWPTGIGWSGGSAPTLINNTRTRDAQVFLLVTRDMGVTWYGKEVVDIDPQTFQLWSWGRNEYGFLGDNSTVDRSSPIQVGTDTNWTKAAGNHPGSGAIKNDGTFWTWGQNDHGMLGQNSLANYSSPVQVGTDTTWSEVSVGDQFMFATKTDGTLWSWGNNDTQGQLALNDLVKRSSPTQVGTNTNWNKITAGYKRGFAIKTDGSLWSWGYGNYGYFGNNTSGPGAKRSSPVQTPGTWSEVADGQYHVMGLKTNGELYAWGYSGAGELGHNENVNRSSPTQVGTETTWSDIASASYGSGGIKTNGTLWTWGRNNYGANGQNNALPAGNLSSPTQVGANTTWSSIEIAEDGATRVAYALKTDNTLWAWGYGNLGGLGQNNLANRSSPVQIPGTDWSSIKAEARGGLMAIKVV